MIFDRQRNLFLKEAETILIVDDEKILLDLGRDILEQSGYRAITAESGEEALAIYHKEKSEIDLVILDLNMPGMDGQDCLQKLQAMDGSVKAIVASGNVGMQDAAGLHAHGYLQKPYPMEIMLKKIREVLDA
jgi:CheY-like chemotaxis protein